MYQQSFSVGGETELTIQIEHGGGDLHLLGSDESYARVQGEGDAADYDAVYQNGTLTLSLHGDCVFFLPHSINLTVSGRNPAGNDAASFGAQIRTELKQWSDLVRDAKITVE